MSTNTPRAIKQADALDKDGWEKPSDFEVADELRRLDAIEQELERIKALEPVAWLIEYSEDDENHAEYELRFVAGTRGDKRTPLFDLTQPKEPTT